MFGDTSPRLLDPKAATNFPVPILIPGFISFSNSCAAYPLLSPDTRRLVLFILVGCTANQFMSPIGSQVPLQSAASIRTNVMSLSTLSVPYLQRNERRNNQCFVSVFIGPCITNVDSGFLCLSINLHDWIDKERSWYPPDLTCEYNQAKPTAKNIPSSANIFFLENHRQFNALQNRRTCIMT